MIAGISEVQDETSTLRGLASPVPAAGKATIERIFTPA
jgi:hypothetical protein